MEPVPMILPRGTPGSLSEALRGITVAEAARPAVEVLARVSWEGLALDPARTPARELLAVL